MYACRGMVSGIWMSRLTGQCPGSRLISQIVALQRFLPRYPVGSGWLHLRWPLAQHGGERHWVPASESPVPEGVRQGPRGNVSPFSRSYKTTNDTPRPVSVHSGEGACMQDHTHTPTHTSAHSPVPACLLSRWHPLVLSRIGATMKRLSLTGVVGVNQV